MDDEDRRLFASLMKDVLYARYGGRLNRFYGDVGINSQTLTNLLEGRSVKPQTITTVTGKLFPATHGDWRKLELFGGSISSDPKGTVGGDEHDATHGGYVAAPGEREPAGVTDSEVLREIRAMREELRAMSERLADVERKPEA